MLTTTEDRTDSCDVLGAKNILAKGMHLLMMQAAHPIFGG